MIFLKKAFGKPDMKGHISYDSIYMKHGKTDKSRDRKWINDCQGLVVEGWGEAANRFETSFGDDENIQKLIAA